MDVQTWKTKARERLQAFANQINPTAPGMVYGSLAAATLLPVVTAAYQGDFSALVALTGVVGGVGGNLIANQFQAWKDRSDEAIASELAEKAQTDPEWRQTLDTVLRELEAPRTVQAILSEADKDELKGWFAATLRQEIAQLGSNLTIEGDWIAGDKIVGDKVGGDKTTVELKASTGVAVGKHITQIINLYRQPDESVNEAHLGQQIAEYLKWVAARYGKLELRGVRRAGRQVVQLDLEEVYVPLEARTYRREELKLSEVLTIGQRLIVVGGPGSGKSTVLQHIAWTLATALFNNNSALATKQLGLKLATDALLPLPIFLPLSAYALQRRKFEAAHDPRDRTLAGFISYYLIEQQSEFNLPRDFFVRLLNSGRGVMILLDGLDEVPDEAERVNVRAAIEKLVTGRSQMYVVVTCRTAAYKERTTLGSGFTEIQVKPLSEAHISALVQQAYRAIYPVDELTRTAKTTELLAGITNLESERQRRLGEKTPRLIDSPLLVRMLLVVHLSERRMPQHRAELYMRTTENMLWPEYALDEEAGERIGRLVGGRPETHRELVQHLAFTLHRRGDKQGREIEEDDLRKLLCARPEFAPLVEDFLELTRLRGTLLEERMRVYHFIHLAFQEFLAARYLAEVVRDPEQIAQFLEAGPLLESWWVETVLLVVGYLSMTALSTAQHFVRRLAGVDANAPQRAPLMPDLQLSAAEMAATACLEWLEEDKALCRLLAQRLAALLTDASLLNPTKPVLRAAVGVALGRLGDPRRGVGVKNGLPEIVWRSVDAGPFIMGSDKRKDKLASDAETPLFTCKLIQQLYQISRYPITVAQYRCFVEAQGYAQSHWWTEAGWQWRQENNITGLREIGGVFETPNHPQVGVSWYEVVAFCAWLSAQLKFTVRLPTEAEWERAARHTDGRVYPWIGEFAATRCNMSETGIGSTAAVGSFPSGQAECGADDLSGNVLEWCSTKWLANYTGYEEKVNDDLAGGARRVLRGGAFSNLRYGGRCAYRHLDAPGNWDHDFGFRVVAPGSGPLVSGG